MGEGQYSTLNGFVDKRGYPVRLCIKSDDLVVLTRLHLEEFSEHDYRLGISSRSRPLKPYSFSFQVFHLFYFRRGCNRPLGDQRLAHDKSQRRSLEHRLSASTGNRNEFDFFGDSRPNQDARGRGNEFGVEALAFEKSLVHRHVRGNMKPASADGPSHLNFRSLRVGGRALGQHDQGHYTSCGCYLYQV